MRGTKFLQCNEAVSRNGLGLQVLFLVRREMKYVVRLESNPGRSPSLTCQGPSGRIAKVSS